ncbi:hypothetical protein DRJ19_03880 [Candidatus Woesearchaeota archaeon]|nr:MAG: hypothetical protein DRJ19_03880 [Candidatus Woesearchaeota archaeon]
MPQDEPLEERLKRIEEKEERKRQKNTKKIFMYFVLPITVLGITIAALRYSTSSSSPSANYKKKGISSAISKEEPGYRNQPEEQQSQEKYLRDLAELHKKEVEYKRKLRELSDLLREMRKDKTYINRKIAELAKCVEEQKKKIISLEKKISEYQSTKNKESRPKGRKKIRNFDEGLKVLIQRFKNDLLKDQKREEQATTIKKTYKKEEDLQTKQAGNVLEKQSPEKEPLHPLYMILGSFGVGLGVGLIGRSLRAGIGIGIALATGASAYYLTYYLLYGSLPF